MHSQMREMTSQIQNLETDLEDIVLAPPPPPSPPSPAQEFVKVVDSQIELRLKEAEDELTETRVTQRNDLYLFMCITL